MDYKAYFLTSQRVGVSFNDACAQLSALLCIMSAHEENCLYLEIEQYKY